MNEQINQKSNWGGARKGSGRKRKKQVEIKKSNSTPTTIKNVNEGVTISNIRPENENQVLGIDVLKNTSKTENLQIKKSNLENKNRAKQAITGKKTKTVKNQETKTETFQEQQKNQDEKPKGGFLNWFFNDDE